MDFADRLIEWQRIHGRHDLPWQSNHDAYRVWLSEIMLQQTQVETVINYYQRFLARFPDVLSLADATLEAVLPLWSGLGYYARARNLHKTAQIIRDRYGGDFPRQMDALTALPGIGRSTAAAIMVFAFGAREAILDGNVKRVLCRYFALEGFPGDAVNEKHLWRLAHQLLPAGHEHMATYIQAQMDLGATVCTRSKPDCVHCPLADQCQARLQGRTEALPQRRLNKKQRPEKHTAMLVLRHRNNVLLVRRPSSGIWGGLLSLPEAADRAAVLGLAARLAGPPVSEVVALPVLRHMFTHFTLTIEPWLVQTDTVTDSAAQYAVKHSCQWLELAQALTEALPAPVKKILSCLPSEIPCRLL